MIEEKYEPALLWPRYIEKKWVSRTLAYYTPSQGSIVTEQGTELTISDFTEFIIALFDNDLLIFIDEFASFPWLDECLKRGAWVPCTELGEAIAIRLKGPRNTTRWIVNCHSWLCSELSVAWLNELREVYAYVGVGTPSTPGAAGQALMRKAWQEKFGLPEWDAEQEKMRGGWLRHRHQRPANFVCQQIEQTSTGARNDTFEMGTCFEMAWEVDRKNGYGAELLELPTGKCYRVFKGHVNDWKTYRVRCRVTIPHQLQLGPFPVRERDETRKKKSKPTFPSKPGEYITYLWKEEVEAARAEGCLVECFEGWGWQETTNDFQYFVDMMTRLRDEAPEHIAPYVKHFLVGAIGRFGMPSGMFVLVPQEEAVWGDKALCDRDHVYDWFIHWVPDKSPTSMPHWFDFIMMKCRLALFLAMKPYAQDDTLISSNTDGFVVKSHADVSGYADRGQPVATGDWRKQPLHDVVVSAPRHLESREKWTTPGIPEKKRVRRYKREKT